MWRFYKISICCAGPRTFETSGSLRSYGKCFNVAQISLSSMSSSRSRIFRLFVFRSRHGLSNFLTCLQFRIVECCIKIPRKHPQPDKSSFRSLMPDKNSSVNKSRPKWPIDNGAGDSHSPRSDGELPPTIHSVATEQKPLDGRIVKPILNKRIDSNIGDPAPFQIQRLDGSIGA